MRQFHLRSVLALVGVIALSLWAGMQIERARPRPPGPRTYTVMRPVYPDDEQARRLAAGQRDPEDVYGHAAGPSHGVERR